MRVDAIQLGVYAFGGSMLALGLIAGLATLARSHRGLAITFTLWSWLWEMTAAYAALVILAVGVPTSIDPLSPATETVLSAGCLAATVPAWWLLHRWRRRRHTRREATRATVQEASATAEHAARVRRTGRIRIG